MDDLVFRIIQMIMLVIVGLAGRYFIPWLKTKISINKLDEALKWVDAFVRAAQQMIKGEEVNKEKLETVTKWTKEKLDEIGVVMTEEQIRALIESAVYEMKGSKQE